MAALQLEAQVRYRLGENGEAIRLYSSLFKEHGVESKEVQTNVLAAYVAGGKGGEVPSVMEAMAAAPGDSFEVAFNSACGLVEAGELAAAEERLLLARRLGARVGCGRGCSLRPWLPPLALDIAGWLGAPAELAWGGLLYGPPGAAPLAH